ncbi:hypothetical protein F5B22DRAFT_657769 [Xylaria bambusicola]|uniref:uncharacterized protein n=1 Tax=Xylaria bambusicola TaxID=326684 RepID=UPI002008541A|nr:uncharacterized protein F5B22DRAFT_657769 [Xylaria bambusicola]KAI0512707.1 hypothetical protein F5B22DRAFT_657769 [Xylaria bambusicola]
MRCHIYSQHTVSVEEQSFHDLLGARCPVCDRENDERSREGERLHNVGFLRPDVLLYNESDGADPRIMSAFKEDLCQDIDAVIIVGTTLHIPLLQNFTARLCKIMKRSKGKNQSYDTNAMVIWLKPLVRGWTQQGLMLKTCLNVISNSAARLVNPSLADRSLTSQSIKNIAAYVRMFLVTEETSNPGYLCSTSADASSAANVSVATARPNFVAQRAILPATF